MRKCLPLLFLFISFSTIAQVQFKVVDANTALPLENVRIQPKNGQAQLSNASGIVAFSSDEPQQFSFFKSGFEPFKADFGAGEHLVELSPKSVNLSEVTVTAFESERPLLEQSAAIAIVSERDFNRFNETSIVNSFNTKPGVRIEERAPASYRISIRGSSLRAPFGVRNVKVYWNGVPFTAPDGTTPLNLLDLSNIRTAEVIKGPSGSIYGAGNGGTINLNSPANLQGSRISSEYSAGSFGLNRFRLGLSQQIGEGGIEASFVTQKADGYRDHSAMDRKVFQLGSFFPVSEKQEIRTQLLISDLNYQIPGALNADQLAADPTQARPGSVNQNSSIAQKSVFASFGHLYRFSEKDK